jgi:glycosyltransferase involved in cell wall biosynthesis
LKTAFVVGSLSFGGAERHTIDLFLSLPSHGIATRLVYLKSSAELMPMVPQARRSDVWCAGLGSGWDTGGLLRLIGYLRRESPDLLVCVNSYPLLYGYLARLFAGKWVPIVEIFHSTELPAGEARKHRFLYSRIFNHCNRIIYVSQNQRQYWESRGLTPKIGRTIQNGIDAEKFHDLVPTAQKGAIRSGFGIPPSGFLIGICAGLRPEKHHRDFIQAVDLLRRRGVEAFGLIIGDGTERQKIEHWIADFKLESAISITGFQADVRPFVAACDVMTIVSHQVETFSIAALEAMALGKPMVMSDVGGASEQVVVGETGFLFQRGDVEALADALEALVDSSLRARMGQAARDRVLGHFTQREMVAQYVSEFSTLIVGR